MTTLTTKRLMLRLAQPADLDALHALVSNYDVVKMTATWPWPADRDFTASRSVPFDPEKGVVGLVFCGEDMVGSMGIAAKGDKAELGYMFAPAHWGKGYATEMGRALIAHCWTRYPWDEITACVFADNGASGRVLEKLGFSEGPRCSGECRARGAILPTRTYRLARS